MSVLVLRPSLQTWTSAAIAVMKTSSVITCVTTSSEDSTAPVAMVTCCTLTTAPAEVRLDFLFVCDGDEGGVSEEAAGEQQQI